MHLPELSLWEEAALPPSEDRPHGTGRSRRTHRPGAPTPPDLRRARLLRTRLRAASLHGLLTCLLFGTPLGWSYVGSTWFAPDPLAANECPEVASFLPPGLQHMVRQRRQTGALSTSDKKTLGTKVCDPALRAMIQPILGNATDVDDLRGLADKAGFLKGGGDPLPALRAFLGGPASD